MTRGKYAQRATSRREHRLEEEVARLTHQLEEERRLRRAEQVEAARALASAKEEVQAHTAEMVHRLLLERVDDMAEKLSAATWKAQRIAMTSHLARLFIAGMISWDRLEGDREVLAFIAAHGDLDVWFHIVDRFFHRMNRAQLRDHTLSKVSGTRLWLSVDMDIEKALSTGPGAEKARKEREALDEVVDQARKAVIDVELERIFDDEEVARLFDPTDEQREMHAEVMETLAQRRIYLSAVGAQR